MPIPALLIVTAATWATAFMFWRRYNRTLEKRWIGCALACLVAGAVVYQALPGSGAFRTNADCFVDWDGRSNRTVCD
jgi:hypothetical protein